MIYRHVGPDRAIFPHITVGGHTLELGPGETVELDADPGVVSLAAVPAAPVVTEPAPDISAPETAAVVDETPVTEA